MDGGAGVYRPWSWSWPRYRGIDISYTGQVTPLRHRLRRRGNVAFILGKSNVVQGQRREHHPHTYLLVAPIAFIQRHRTLVLVNSACRLSVAFRTAVTYNFMGYAFQVMNLA